MTKSCTCALAAGMIWHTFLIGIKGMCVNNLQTYVCQHTCAIGIEHELEYKYNMYAYNCKLHI